MARERLASTSQSAALDAEVLLGAVTGWDQTTRIIRGPTPLDAAFATDFERLVNRRLAGEPIAYITGRREFWSLDMKVSKATLIPREDTETLVATAIERIPEDAQWDILDLGTGSGNIAIAIHSERPKCRIIGVDINPSAIDLANENAARLGAESCRFISGRWFDSLDGDCFHMVIANPPYIRRDDPHLTIGDVAFEPRAALVSGDDGLDDIGTIVNAAPAHLHQGGWLLLEHGADQANKVRELLKSRGFANIFTCNDFGMRERVTGGRAEAACL